MPWSPLTKPPSYNKTIIGHLTFFLVGLLIVLFALYQGLALLSMMHPQAMQIALVNMKRKQTIIEINRFMYTGNEKHYYASIASLTKLIDFRDAMGRLMFEKHVPLTAVQLQQVKQFIPDIEDSAPVVQMYVGAFVDDGRGRQVWEESTDILRRQRALCDEIFEWYKTGVNDPTALAEFERQIQDYDRLYGVRVETLINNMLDANHNIRYVIFGIISFLAISLIVFAERITRSRLRHSRELFRYEEINKRYRKFPETNPYPVISFSSDGTLTYFNSAAERDFPNLNILKENHPFLRVILHEFRYEDQLISEVELRHVEYKDKHYDVIIRKVGNDFGYHAYVFDSSVVYVQKNQIEDNLREKELLISEIHHRVNNNLAIILGFLELSEEQMSDPQCRRLNELNMTRIRTVSVINRALYDHGDFTNVDFTDCMRVLEKNNTIRVTFENAQRMLLNVNQAFTLALLLNEIMQEMRVVGCCEDKSLNVARQDNRIIITITSPKMSLFKLPDNSITELMMSQLEVDWKGYDEVTNTISFEFDSREISGAMATRHLSNGLS